MGSLIPVALLRRLRSVTAPSESRPSSLKARCGPTRIGRGVPQHACDVGLDDLEATAASRIQGRLRVSAASDPCASARIRVAIRNSPLRIAGRFRPSRGAQGSAVEADRHEQRPGAVSAVSNSSRPCCPRGGRCRLFPSVRRHSPRSPAIPPARSHSPQARVVAGSPSAQRCWASASRNALAAA